MLAALATSHALRDIASSDSLAIDHERRRSVFSTAVLALLLGCVERIDDNPEDITVD